MAVKKARLRFARSVEQHEEGVFAAFAAGKDGIFVQNP
jgi:hypothetical protein